MRHGRSLRLLPVILLLLTFAALPAAARPAPASDLTVTLLSAGPKALQVQGADGRAFPVKITRATWILQRGLVAAPRDLLPGETLRVRLGRGADGAALLVCDADTADALVVSHGRPLSGTLLGVEGRVWTVQTEGGSVPLPVLLSARTLFRAGGSAVSASAFGPGASVTITTRGLANGLLAAVSVSDAPLALPGPDDDRRTPKPVSLSGVIVEVRPDLGLLTFQDEAGAAQTAAVGAATRIRSAGKAAALGDLAAGMRVRVRLGASQDAAGNPVASSVSAFAVRPARKALRKKGLLPPRP